MKITRGLIILLFGLIPAAGTAAQPQAADVDQAGDRLPVQPPADPKSPAAYNSIPLTRFAATIATLYRIESPKQADPPLDWVCDKVRKLSPGPIDRVVIYNPDAVAQWLILKHADLFKPVREHAPIELPMAAMMPSVTPVCFGSMYTGARPEVHGIQEYTKPVIKIDTLFDCLLRSRKRPAIVATSGSSMSKMFLERKMDYFILDDAHLVLKMASKLIEQDRHDFLVVYNEDYDSTMHRTGTEAKEALQALRFQVEGFDALAHCIKKHWTRHNTLLTFSTDHGVHDTRVFRLTLGDHGKQMPEDINIVHFLGVIPRKGQPARPN